MTSFIVFKNRLGEGSVLTLDNYRVEGSGWVRGVDEWNSD